jgi:adenylyltransferase/sulfurtransferase
MFSRVPSTMSDSGSPFTRYARQMVLPSIGAAGQARLAASRVALVGCGALGCAIADTLVRAGIGELVIIDRDVVEETNLQRQCLFDEEDARAGTTKVEAAFKRLSRVNSSVELIPIAEDVLPENVEAAIIPARTHMIIDGTDNFDTRYLLNDVAVKYGVPLVYGGVIAMRGVAAPILPGVGPCLRCIAPESPAVGSMPTCETAGVLGSAVQIAANIQASIALKILSGESMSPMLVDFDLERMEFKSRDIVSLRDESCPCCHAGHFEFLNRSTADEAAAMCGRDTVQIPGSHSRRIDLSSLSERLRRAGEVNHTAFMLRFTPAEQAGRHVITVFPNGRMLVRGTDRIETARTLVAKYIGV